MSAVAEALRALADGDREGAARTAAGSTRGPLGPALAEHLRRPPGVGVYDEAGAFEAFIGNGANPELYRRTIGALADLHAGLRPGSVLDVGPGDGRVTAGALGPATASVDLVEPSADLLARAVAALDGHGADVRPHALGAAHFLDGLGPATGWDLVQSTFALHTLPPEERRVLGAIARRTEHLAIAEFDVPAFGDDGARLAYLAERYEEGVREYADHPEVVAGFLMPVLAGQVDPGRERHTYEQPASQWVEQLRDAGFADVAERPLLAYWWAPAVLITASP